MATSTNLPGDFNNDCVVDLADYTIWADNLEGDSSVLNGNGTGAATVVQEDYELWLANFGQKCSENDPTYCQGEWKLISINDGTCADVECQEEEILGSCCVDEECYENWTETTCLDANGRWRGGVECTDTLCGGKCSQDLGCYRVIFQLKEDSLQWHSRRINVPWIDGLVDAGGPCMYPRGGYPYELKTCNSDGTPHTGSWQLHYKSIGNNRWAVWGYLCQGFPRPPHTGHPSQLWEGTVICINGKTRLIESKWSCLWGGRTEDILRGEELYPEFVPIYSWMSNTDFVMYNADGDCGCCYSWNYGRCFPLQGKWDARGVCCNSDAHDGHSFEMRSGGYCSTGIGTTIGHCDHWEQIAALEEDCDTKKEVALASLASSCSSLGGTWIDNKRKEECPEDGGCGTCERTYAGPTYSLGVWNLTTGCTGSKEGCECPEVTISASWHTVGEKITLECEVPENTGACCYWEDTRGQEGEFYSSYCREDKTEEECNALGEGPDTHCSKFYLGKDCSDLKDDECPGSSTTNPCSDEKTGYGCSSYGSCQPEWGDWYCPDNTTCDRGQCVSCWETAVTTFESCEDCLDDLLGPPASWNCISPGNCQDPGDGTGTYTTLTACNTACPPPPEEPPEVPPEVPPTTCWEYAENVQCERDWGVGALVYKWFLTNTTTHQPCGPMNWQDKWGCGCPPGCVINSIEYGLGVSWHQKPCRNNQEHEIFNFGCVPEGSVIA